MDELNGKRKENADVKSDVKQREKELRFQVSIHPKRWFPRFQESADNFEFSAERLSEKTKSIKITLFAELLTVIFPICSVIEINCQ